MLCCIGDLAEDVVVRLSDNIAKGTDTEVSIERRRGGSAANVAVSAAAAGAASRFIGMVGTDAIGSVLVDEMSAAGVDPRVQRRGRSGTIVVLVEPGGERSMLPDRGASTELEKIRPEDLDGVSWLHVPAYSLCVEPLASSSIEAIHAVRADGGMVSIDVSSVAIINAMGTDAFAELIAALTPDVVFCNEDEGALLGVGSGLGLYGVGVTVVKAGNRPAVAYSEGALIATVPAPVVERVTDTTGAGDAFAAGFIVAAMASEDVTGAMVSGHQAAANVLNEYAS